MFNTAYQNFFESLRFLFHLTVLLIWISQASNRQIFKKKKKKKRQKH